MAVQPLRRSRAVLVGLLVLLLLGADAMPAAAGTPGGAGHRHGGRSSADAPGSGWRQGDVTAKQASAGSVPTARKSQGSVPRPPRQKAASGPRAERLQAAAQAEPVGAGATKPEQWIAAGATEPEQWIAAGATEPEQRIGARATKPEQRKPQAHRDAPRPDREPRNDAPHDRRRSKSLSDRMAEQFRSSSVTSAGWTASQSERPSQARATVGTVASVVTNMGDPSTARFAPPPVAPIQAPAVVTSVADPSTGLFAAPPVAPIQAAVALEPRPPWPRLPGPAGHPAFPALLAAVLLGFVALGFRGDRRDPKLAAAAIDDRDGRTRFR